jgi:hypothetical protein
MEVFEKQLTDNPEEVAAAIVNEMDPRQRAAFLSQLGISQNSEGAERTHFDIGEYEPASDLEAAMLDRWNDVEAIPHIVADQQAFKQEMLSHFQHVAPNVDHANLSAMIAMEQLNVIAETLGIQFPDIDYKAMSEELRDGRKTYRSVIEKHTAPYKTLASNAKQRSAPRPSTPANQSRQRVDTVNPNSSYDGHH